MAMSFLTVNDKAVLNTSPVGGAVYVSMSMLMYTAAFANDNKFVISADLSGSTFLNSLYVRPNNTGGVFDVGMSRTGGVFCGSNGTRPTGSAWHQYLFTWDRINDNVYQYCDGAVIGSTVAGTSMNDTAFGLGAFNIGWFPSLALVCRMADLAIWTGVVFGLGEAKDLTNGVHPLRLRPDRLSLYMPLLGVGREPVYGRMGVLSPNYAVLTGTAAIAGPYGERNLPRARRKPVMA